MKTCLGTLLSLTDQLNFGCEKRAYWSRKNNIPGWVRFRNICVRKLNCVKAKRKKKNKSENFLSGPIPAYRFSLSSRRTRDAKRREKERKVSLARARVYIQHPICPSVETYFTFFFFLTNFVDVTNQNQSNDHYLSRYRERYPYRYLLSIKRLYKTKRIRKQTIEKSKSREFWYH